MIGGEADVVERLDSDLRRARPRGRCGGAHAAGAMARRRGRAGLPPLRAAWRRPFREDGPQRHRVRPDGRLRRGAQHPQERQRRLKEHAADAETTPLGDRSSTVRARIWRTITEVWRRGSVIASWLLDLTAAALQRRPAARRRSAAASPIPAKAAGRSRRRSTKAVPAHVLSAALFDRFSSRGEDGFADKVLSAMRSRLRRPSREAARSRAMSAPGTTFSASPAVGRDAAERAPTRSSCSASPATSRTRRSSRRSTRWSRAARWNVPVIGVASTSLGTDEVNARVRASVAAAGAVDPATLDKLLLARSAMSAATTTTRRRSRR